MHNIVVAGLMGVMMAVAAANVAAKSRAGRPWACLRRQRLTPSTESLGDSACALA